MENWTESVTDGRHHLLSWFLETEKGFVIKYRKTVADTKINGWYLNKYCKPKAELAHYWRHLVQAYIASIFMNVHNK